MDNNDELFEILEEMNKTLKDIAKCIRFFYSWFIVGIVFAIIIFVFSLLAAFMR